MYKFKVFNAVWMSLAVVFCCLAPLVSAKDIKITLPKRTHATPVQRLNQEGVEAVRKHQYEKAGALFYKAYLYDPDDPFTLNNLGYIAEIEGQVDRAAQLYQLAAQQQTDAVIDSSSSAKLRGISFRDEVASIHDDAMRVSRANVAAVRLLSQGRGSEADAMLETALAVDPHNPFTLNNLGVAKELEGDLPAAVKYYQQAANTRASQPVVVTYNRGWRGKPVSDMAADNVERLSARIRTQSAAEQAAVLNVQGVMAINRNDLGSADKAFRQAFTLNPASAFSINNIGYLSEMNGDEETAQFYYERAQQAMGAGAKIGLATDRAAEGKKLLDVSNNSEQKVNGKLSEQAALRRTQGGPVELKLRDNTPVVEPSEPPVQNTEPPSAAPSPSPNVPRPPASSTPSPTIVPRPPTP